MSGYQTCRTAAPALVCLARSTGAANAGFLTLILTAGFTIDRLAGVLITVVENFNR